LSDLKKGQRGRIRSLDESVSKLRLLEMGCLPGEIVEMQNYAPMRDPLVIIVNGMIIAIRKENAEEIEIELL
jgi:ferrous iron transport protein A